MAARIDNYEPEDLEMTWGDEEDAPVTHHREPRPRVAPRNAPNPRLIIALVAGALAVLLLSLGWMSGSAAGRRYVQEADLAINEYEVRADAAEGAAAFWESKATSATAAFEAVESDVASLTESLEQWQLYAKEASETIATLKQQKATPKPSAPKPVQTSYNTAGVEQWRGLAAEWVTYYGGAPDNVEQFLRVMTGESHGDPSATNGEHKGLMQIASNVHAKAIAEKAAEWEMAPDLYDPAFNIRFAAYMSAGGTNWSSWSVKP